MTQYTQFPPCRNVPFVVPPPFMPRYDFHSPRLYVEAALKAAAEIALDRAQAHYLGTVLRLKAGDRVLVFNGRDGEWSAAFAPAKRAAALTVDERTRPQSPPAD